MPTLILVIITSVIPVFFVLMFAMSSYHRLKGQRSACAHAQQRCESLRQRRDHLLLDLLGAARVLLPVDDAAVLALENTHHLVMANVENLGRGQGSDDAGINDSLERLRIRLESVSAGKSQASWRSYYEQLISVQASLIDAQQEYESSARSYLITKKAFPGNIICSLMRDVEQEPQRS